MGPFVLAKGLVAGSVSFGRKLRLLIPFTFPRVEAELGRQSTEQSS